MTTEIYSTAETETTPTANLNLPWISILLAFPVIFMTTRKIRERWE
ncbi:MAG: hypothetical protein ACXAD7_18930 [Candidatus Kariarchaeaceae archaeon]